MALSSFMTLVSEQALRLETPFGIWAPALRGHGVKSVVVCYGYSGIYGGFESHIESMGFFLWFI